MPAGKTRFRVRESLFFFFDVAVQKFEFLERGIFHVSSFGIRNGIGMAFVILFFFLQTARLVFKVCSCCSLLLLSSKDNCDDGGSECGGDGGW